jgi:oligoribonuclease (3'-5' exoribonuclease)
MSAAAKQERAKADIIGLFQSLGNKHDFILCGSGVSHFDRRFLAEHMPRLTKWFAITPSTWGFCAARLN